MKKFVSILVLVLFLFSVNSVFVGADDKVVEIDPMFLSDRYASKDYEAPLTNATRYTQINTGSATTYYVNAQKGNDSTGLGTAQKPFKTIDRAMVDIGAGDTIVLQEGIYREKISAQNLKGTKENPITIMGEENSDVAVTSYEPVNTDWAKHSDNIYYAFIGRNKDVSHALRFKEDKFTNLVQARWPDVDSRDVLGMQRAICQEGSDNYKLCSDELPEGDWNGAYVFAWTGEVWEQYLSFSREIKNYKPGESLEFTRIIPDEWNQSAVYKPNKGDWFYLTNSFAGLSATDEYYYDSKKGMLYLVADQAPKSGEIYFTSRDLAVELDSCEYINFANINFIGGGVKLKSTNHCTLANANVYYANWFSYSDGYLTMHEPYNNNFISGQYNRWYNSEIAYTMSSGFLIANSYNTIENCIIHDVNITGSYNGAINLDPDIKGTVIRRNSMYRSGRFLVYFAISNSDGYAGTVIEYNDCYDGMYLTRDGGLIYAYGVNGNGVTIRNNWVHDTDKYGARGIYIDNNCSGFNVYRNCVWNINEAGLVLNTHSENNMIYNNTILNCPIGISVWPKNPDSSMKGTVIKNNIIMGTCEVVEGELAPVMQNNLFTSSPKLDKFLVPQSSATDIIDKSDGIYSYDYTAYAGKSFDIGAYERGGEYYVPGADFTDENLFGDANYDNVIDAKDVLALRKSLANRDVKIDKYYSDVSGNKVVDAVDVLLLSKYLAGHSMK